MKKLFNFRLLVLVGVLITSINQMWAGASWIGNSYITVGPDASKTWYNAGGGGQAAGDFDGHDFGTVTALYIGGQVQTYGQDGAAGKPATLYYQFDNGSSNTISLPWFDYASNNNWFQSHGNSIDISGLSAGEHSLKIWFYQSDGNQTDDHGGSKYVATFTKEASHNVTISYKCSTATIKDATTESAVGESTARDLTAPDIDGYTFSSWSKGAGVNITSGTTSSASISITTNSSGALTLTANYTANACSLYKITAAKDGTPSSVGVMTFDPTTKAYYYDVTTNSSPYYFRFYYNRDTYYSTNWAAGGYDSGKTVTANGSKVDCDQIVGGWINKPSIVYPGENTAIRIWFDYQNKDVWITADKNKQYVLRGSTYADNEVTGGMPGWSATTSYFNGLASGTTGTITASLSAYTKYKLKVYDLYNKDWYGYSSNTEYELINGTLATTGTGSGNDFNFTTTAAGTYTFTVDNSSGLKVKVDYPTAYTVTYYNKLRDIDGTISTSTTGGSISGMTGSASGSRSSGEYFNTSETVTLTHSTANGGYSWIGWYNSEACSSAYSTGGNVSISDGSRTIAISNLAADTKVAALYEEVATTVTLANDGHGHVEIGGATVTSTTVGKTTSRTIVAVNSTGYHFNAWTATSGTDYTIGNTGNASTTLTGKGSGSSSQTVTATFEANTYQVSFSANGGTGDDMDNQEFTYDEAQNLSANSYEKTGYNFAGWATSSGGEVVYADEASVSNLTAVNGATFPLYAKWSAASYSVTLSQLGETGYGSSGTGSVSATYDAGMPAIASLPTPAPGYKFMGYFTDHDGEGTQYYNADGSSTRNWNIAENTTLYAFFKQTTITDFTHEATIAKASTTYLTVNPTLDPASGFQGYVDICWTLLYADTDNPVDGSHWSVEADTEGGSKPRQVKYTLTSLENGSYKVKAVLKANATSGFTPCSAGTELQTATSTFSIIGDNTVTIKYVDNADDKSELAAAGSVNVPASGSASVTAPSIIGYKFHHWVIGDGVTCTSGTVGDAGIQGDATITISANYDGTIKAMYNKKQMIYFNNTLGWDTVFVYFYNNNYYWGGSNQGTGADASYHGGSYTGKYGGMIKIAGTNIYYFDLEANSVSTSLTNVAFTKIDQHGYGYFDHNEVIGRSDYSGTLSMYVPIKKSTDPEVKNSPDYSSNYYFTGYWMNYPDNTGYTLKIYNKKTRSDSPDPGTKDPVEIKSIPFEFSADKKLPMSVTTDLEAGKTYGFKIYRADGTNYGNANTMTNGHSGDEGQAVWEFTTATNAGLTTTGAGDYTFTLNYGEKTTNNFYYLVGVHYPESDGDFRVLYKDDVKTNWRPSATIPASTDTTIVSYFVRKNSTPYIKAQKCSLTYDDPENPNPEHMTLSWADQGGGANIISMDTINKYGDGVYNFYFTKNNGNLVLSRVTKYTGNFYIRVDGAGYSNWDKYIAEDHLMPYSDYSFKQKTDKYSHYFTKWYEVPNESNKKNIKFVVANEYSPYISDTITQDGVADEYVDASGTLCRSANIRFMYNYETNEATRAYVDGAQHSGSEFLVLIPSNNSSIYDAETEGTAYTQLTFTDKGNWVYEANVWAVPGAKYKLKSHFGAASSAKFDENGEITQYFKGAETGDNEYETLVGGTSGSRLNVRLLYDFKTNRLVSAYVPSSTINSSIAINADVMFIREGQEDATQVTFNNNAVLSAITNIYSVVRFNKWTLNNRSTTGAHALLGSPKSRYERDLYWISFPFDVKLSDVFGFGTYGTHWIIEYYDGAGRAANGYWVDSPSNWKFVTPAMKNSFTLKAGTGYLLALDLDELVCNGEGDGEQADIWKNIQTADLIFPGNVTSISSSSVSYTLPAHTCTIGPRFEGGESRVIPDSHWNVLGVPTYLNTESASFSAEAGTDWISDGKPKYIYTWNPADNSLTSVSATGFTYHSMTAYMVQYYGTVTFTTSVTPSSIVARMTDTPDKEYKLELINDDEQIEDQTFVRMTDNEGVTTGFEFGDDLSKEMNRNRGNIWTITTDTVKVAGNSLPHPLTTTVVPVGVKIAANGEYTFSMPEGTNGGDVWLIDNANSSRTNLGLMDYTVNLTTGTYEGRFSLEFPVQNVVTDIDNDGMMRSDELNDENDVRKVFVGGRLYILRDGKAYDATGAQVR